MRSTGLQRLQQRQPLRRLVREDEQLGLLLAVETENAARVFHAKEKIDRYAVAAVRPRALTRMEEQRVAGEIDRCRIDLIAQNARVAVKVR